MIVTALTGHEVEIPAAATRLAQKAEQHGWSVVIATAQAPAVGADLLPLMEYRWEDNDPDADGPARSRIPTDVQKIVQTVSVRCERDGDYVFAVWADGSFDFASRPRTLSLMSSTGIVDHLTRPVDEHRWIPVAPTLEACAYHVHIRARVPYSGAAQ